MQRNFSNEITINKLIQLVLKKWYFFGISIAISAFVIGFFYFMHPNQYKSTATLIINDDFKNVSVVEKTNIVNVGATMENQIQLMSAHMNFIKLVDSLNLYTKSYFKQNFKWQESNRLPYSLQLPDELLKNNVGKFVSYVTYSNQIFNININYYTSGFFSNESFSAEIKVDDSSIETPWGLFKIIKNNEFDLDKSYKLKYETCSLLSRVEELKSSIAIKLLKKETRLLELSMVSAQPQNDRKIINALIHIYFNSIQLEKENYYLSLVDFVNQKLDTVSTTLSYQESKVESFKKSYQLANINEQSSIMVSHVTSAKNKITQMESQIIMYDFLLDYLLQKGKYDLIPENSEIEYVTRSLLRSYNDEIRKYNQLLSTSNSENPVVLSTQNNISLLENNIKNNLSVQIKVINIELSKLKKEYNKNISQLENIPNIQKQYNQMNRELTLIKNNFISLSQKKEDYLLLAYSKTLSSRIVNKAYTTSVSSMGNSKLLFVFLIIFSFVLTLFVIYLIYFKTDKIKVVDIYKSFLELFKQYPVIIPLYSNALDENTRLIRNKLLDQKRKVISVTSTFKSEGNTLLAKKLAKSFENLDLKVIYLDLNVNNPSVDGIGVLNYILSENNEIDSYIQNIDGINMLTLGQHDTTNNSADILIHERFFSLIDTLKSEYDFVICDLPAIDESSVIPIILRRSDNTVIVNKIGTVTYSALEELRLIFPSFDSLQFVAFVPQEYKL